jgi:signal transduction histidine kinase
VHGRARWIGWAALVIAAGAALAIPAPTFSPKLAVAVMSAAAAVHLSLAALTAARYRAGSDPHDLFLAAGFLSLGIQITSFGVVWPLVHPIPGSAEPEIRASIEQLGQVSSVWGSAPTIGMLLGTATMGACFALAQPWRERRGRRPIRGRLVLLTVLATLAVADVAVWLVSLRRGPCAIAPRCVRQVDPGATGLLLAVAATILLAVAAVRELLRSDAHPHPGLCVAFAAALPFPLAAIGWPTTGLGYLAWTDTLLLVVAVISAGALLLAQGEETSRMRRDTDRARAVMGGRAEIASTLAHEVRSPVATIKSLASTTSQNYDRLSDTERREFVGLIEQQATRLLDTVGQAALALKVDAGTLVYDRRPLDLATAVREGIGSAQTVGHHLIAELAPGLVVAVDRMHLAEAVRQVVDNAAKFSPPDAPIRVTSAMNGQDALIEVADGGPGIPEERREEVFERFARWRPAGYEDRPGAGLGLFIARAIVSEHGGDMFIEAAPDGGTIVRIRIPMEG